MTFFLRNVIENGNTLWKRIRVHSHIVIKFIRIINLYFIKNIYFLNTFVLYVIL